MTDVFTAGSNPTHRVGTWRKRLDHGVRLLAWSAPCGVSGTLPAGRRFGSLAGARRKSLCHRCCPAGPQGHYPASRETTEGIRA